MCGGGGCRAEGGREIQESGDKGGYDSHCHMAETNTTLKSNYPPIKKIF